MFRRTKNFIIKNLNFFKYKKNEFKKKIILAFFLTHTQTYINELNKKYFITTTVS